MGMEKVGMLPIVGNFTSELLDEFDPVLVERMLHWVSDEKYDSEPEAVFDAIAYSKHFRTTLNAAIEAMRKHPGGADKGGKMLVTLCLIAGWKLCEHRMEQIAAKSVA